MDKLDFVCSCVLKDMAKDDNWTESYESLSLIALHGGLEGIAEMEQGVTERINSFCALFDAIEHLTAIYDISHEEQSKTAAKRLMRERVRKYLQDEKKKRKA